MTFHNGLSARIAAFVAEHPGCTRDELLAGCAIADRRQGMPTYCRKAGMIHAAGPRGSQRYYPSHELAAAAHQGLVAEVRERRLALKRAAWHRDNARKKQLRSDARVQVLDDLRDYHAQRKAVRLRAISSLPKHVIVPKNVRITIAPPLRDRWAA